MDAPLRQKVCRRCNRIFAICVSCDRGHAYCSSACRTKARRASQRAARQRHRRSPEGRLDHRDHQRAYRARVRDQTSRRTLALATLPADTSTDRVPTVGAGAIAHILETRRRQRGLKPPIPMVLPDRPGVRDLDVTPHRLETYDELTRSDPNDAE